MLTSLFLLTSSQQLKAQQEEKKEATNSPTEAPKTSSEDTKASSEAPKTSSEAPKTSSGAKDFTGLSVSPSTLHFNLSAGTSKSMEVKMKNDTKQKYIFQANFSDFIMGTNGKPIGQKNGSTKYGLSQWASVSPSYFELQPGETKKIVVNINVPAGDESNHAAWTVLMLDEVTKRAPLDVNGTSNTIALGITPSIGFGVYIYQNPPNLSLDKIEIEQFSYRDSLNKRVLKMSATNTGDGIGFCTTYVEITNLATGKQEKLKGQKFTILPGFDRVFSYEIPKALEKGKYSAVGVVDTNNPDLVTAAELEFVVE
jgi:hypothetical protein